MKLSIKTRSFFSAEQDAELATPVGCCYSYYKALCNLRNSIMYEAGHNKIETKLSKLEERITHSATCKK
jgi:hypothetical protein